MRSIDYEREERAWTRYRPIGGVEYEAANDPRKESGVVQVAVIGTPEHNITTVAAIRVDPNTGEGANGHEYNPSAQSMSDTETAYAEWRSRTPTEKQAVIYEGDERIIGDRDEAIRQATDSGLVQHLANRDRVPLVRGESLIAEEIATMLAHGVTHEEAAALLVARNMANWDMTNSLDLGSQIHYQAAVAGVTGFHKYSEAEKRSLLEVGRGEEAVTEMATQTQQLIPVLNELYASALEGNDLFLVSDGAIRLNPQFANNVTEISMGSLSWNGSNRINEIAKLDIEVRDRAIFRNILREYDQGRSPFVDYGGSHIVCLELALRAYVEAA
jgi:hypothetical protein